VHGHGTRVHAVSRCCDGQLRVRVWGLSFV
jgi:hypothetical protein